MSWYSNVWQKRAQRGVFGVALLASAEARAETFEPGALIIPMDIELQDAGMFTAYGLVYELLRAGVPVRWAILPGKSQGGVDLAADVERYATSGAPFAHSFRGGPWIIEHANAAEAMPIIEAWQSRHRDTVVVESISAFEAPAGRELVAAPRIAVFGNGAQDRVRGYMLAAGIADSQRDPAWDSRSPDLVTVSEVAGPSSAVHTDGALFDEEGNPRFCHVIAAEGIVSSDPEALNAVAELRAFLAHPTHLLAQGAAALALETLQPHGFFLTYGGLLAGGRGTSEVHVRRADAPVAQVDEGWGTGGSTHAVLSLPATGSYKAGGVAIVTAARAAEGAQDVLVSGFLDGACSAESPGCLTAGRVSFLAGDEYPALTPVSQHPDASGARVFFNALFDTTCASADGAGGVDLELRAPVETTGPNIEVELAYSNPRLSPALGVVVQMVLPDGVSVVDAGGGSFEDGLLSWDVDTLGPKAAGSVAALIELDAPGPYQFGALANYHAGVTAKLATPTFGDVEYFEQIRVATTTSLTTAGMDSGDDDVRGTETSGCACETGTQGDGTWLLPIWLVLALRRVVSR